MLNDVEIGQKKMLSQHIFIGWKGNISLQKKENKWSNDFCLRTEKGLMIYA